MAWSVHGSCHSEIRNQSFEAARPYSTNGSVTHDHSCVLAVGVFATQENGL